MKTHIEKRSSDWREPESGNEVQEELDIKALLAALPVSDPTPYGVSGEEYLKRWGTFDFDPEFFKEFEELQKQMRELYSQSAEE